MISVTDPMLEVFQNPQVTAKGETRAFVELSDLKTLWFNTGTLCNLSCQNCYIESSPRNDRLLFLTPKDVEYFLDEVLQENLPVELIGFTGGEPFVNPQIISLIHETLKRGFSLLVLTNAYRVLNKHKKALREINEFYGSKLKIRVSLDHFTKKGHEGERGEKTFDDTLKEIKWLHEEGFELSLAGRTLKAENPEMARQGYSELLRNYGISWEISTDKLALFPEMDLKREVPEITTACWGILGKNPEQQMCSSERMIVRRKGQSKPEIMPCTLLADEDQFVLGESLKNSQTRVQLNHPFCAQFCVLGGASCSAQK